MKTCPIAIALFVALSALSTAEAATIRVPANAATIQQAIDAAAAGDTVLVSPGTYVENITFRGKAITVASERGPAVTIIDGNRTGSVVTFASGENRNAVLAGFTVRNGANSFSGGGVADSELRAQHHRQLDREQRRVLRPASTAISVRP